MLTVCVRAHASVCGNTPLRMACEAAPAGLVPSDEGQNKGYCNLSVRPTPGLVQARVGKNMTFYSILFYASSPGTQQARLSLRSSRVCNRSPMHQPPSARPGCCGCMSPACEREQIAYSSLLRRPDTVRADPEAMQARLVRSRLA